MKIGIMQPYFFPYMGYWQLINAVDKYIVYDDVAYIKGGWIARNNILLDGKKHLITLPLKNSSSFRNIDEIEVTEDRIAINKLMKTLKAAYAKAPYYGEVMPMIENIILRNKSIALLNYNAIIQINKYLGVNTEIILSSTLEKESTLKGQDKVIYINKMFGGDIYINAIGGRELYNGRDFMKNGIELKFLKMGDIKYAQYKKEFVPGLSIIDVLMFNGREDMKGHLENYSLI